MVSAIAISPSSGESAELNRQTRGWILGYALYAVFLGVAAARNVHRLNPDAIAYLRIAHYAATGQLDLMISGCWGPLLSWLIAPLLLVGSSALIAARIVLAASALLFTLASQRLLAASGLTRRSIVIGTTLSAMLTVEWSVLNITPDLLAGALLIAAVAEILTLRWTTDARSQLLTGALFGVAYYAKPIALPFAVVTAIAFAVVLAWTRVAALRPAARAASITLLATVVIVAPWVAILSAKYGRFTISTSGPIARAFVAPPDLDSTSPTVNGFREPEFGRVAVTEDPSFLDYAQWSAFDNAAHRAHQVHLIRQNASAIWKLGIALDLLRLTFIALFAAGVAVVWRRGPRWLLVSVPAFVLVVAYLPLYANDVRYYYVVAICGVVAALGWCEEVGKRLVAASVVALAIVIASFGAYPIARSVPRALRGTRDEATVIAERIASRLDHRRVNASLAGEGSIGSGQTGLYAAYFAGQRWYGEDRSATLQRLRASGATLYVASAGSALERSLRSTLRDVTPQFVTARDSSAPIRIYALRPLTPVSPRR